MNPIKRVSPDLPLSVLWNNTCDIVYVRKNIELHSDGDSPYYTYDEYKYNSHDFSVLYFEQLRADLDYLSMMAEVDL